MLLGLHTYSFHLHGMGQNWGGYKLQWEPVWDVFGLMTTDRAVSPTVSTFEVTTSLVLLTLVYGVLAVVEVKLLLTYIARGADPVDPDHDPSAPHTDDRPLAVAY